MAIIALKFNLKSAGCNQLVEDTRLGVTREDPQHQFEGSKRHQLKAAANIYTHT